MLRWKRNYVNRAVHQRMLKSLTGLRHVIHAETQNEMLQENQKEYNQARREERAKGSQLCE